MAKYAIVKNGMVINSVEWDGAAEWTPPENCEAIKHNEASIGWSYDGVDFARPPEAIDPNMKPLLRVDPVLEFLTSKGLVQKGEYEAFVEQLATAVDP